MKYIVKSVVCDYGVFEKTDNGEQLKVICNSLSNAELIADILNTDLENTKYKMVASSKIDNALADMQLMLDQEVLGENVISDVGQGIAIAMGLLRTNIGD